MHIAAKYEEIYPPELKEFLKVTSNEVSKSDVLELEFQILSKIEFNVTFPSSFRFMERFARVAQINEKTQLLAQYMCDVCLLDSLLVKQKPSLIAALCIYTAQRVVKG